MFAIYRAYPLTIALVGPVGNRIKFSPPAVRYSGRAATPAFCLNDCYDSIIYFIYIIAATISHTCYAAFYPKPIDPKGLSFPRGWKPEK